MPRMTHAKPAGECPRGGPHDPFYARIGTFTITSKDGSVRTKGKPKALKCRKCGTWL